MPARRLPIRRLRTILQLSLSSASSHRKIACACRVSAATVSTVTIQAQAAGLLTPVQLGRLTDSELDARVRPREAKETRPVPDWSTVETHLLAGDTRETLWKKYLALNPDGYGYSAFCEAFNRWRSSQDKRDALGRRAQRQKARSPGHRLVQRHTPPRPTPHLRTTQRQPPRLHPALFRRPRE